MIKTIYCIIIILCGDWISGILWVPLTHEISAQRIMKCSLHSLYTEGNFKKIDIAKHSFFLHILLCKFTGMQSVLTKGKWYLGYILIFYQRCQWYHHDWSDLLCIICFQYGCCHALYLLSETFPSTLYAHSWGCGPSTSFLPKDSSSKGIMKRPPSRSHSNSR